MKVVPTFWIQKVCCYGFAGDTLAAPAVPRVLPGRELLPFNPRRHAQWRHWLCWLLLGKYTLRFEPQTLINIAKCFGVNSVARHEFNWTEGDFFGRDEKSLKTVHLMCESSHSLKLHKKEFTHFKAVLLNKCYKIFALNCVFHDRPVWRISVRLSDRSKVTQNKINFFKNCSQWGLNALSPDHQSLALPTELSHYLVVCVNY